MMQTTPAAARQASRYQRDSEARVQLDQGAGSPAVEVRDLEKSYRTARGTLSLFKSLNLRVEAREMVAIVGQSGAGKSTLLHILGALDTPSSGKVYCASIDVAKLSPRQAAAFRNRQIGYVWQFHYLLPEFTAIENVAMPLLAGGVKRKVALETASRWLTEVGLEERYDHRSGELSGGEQQRVAIARALAVRPELLIADEPTGQLDSETGRQIMRLLRTAIRAEGVTVLVATHDRALIDLADTVLSLADGRIAADPVSPRP
jgi:lipoprotein-releasing system ATP-binding protein